MDWIELPPGGGRRTGLARAGLTREQRRWFDGVVVGVVLMFAVAWVFAIVHSIRTGAPRPGLAGRMTANPLSPESPPPAPYLLDAALQRLAQSSDYGGISGEVRVLVQEPGQPAPFADSIAEGVEVEYTTEGGDTIVPGDSTPPPGIWNVLLRARDGVRRVPDLAVLSAVPLSQKRSGRIGSYLIGSWPDEGKAADPDDAYAPPRGLVRVTPDQLDLPVSRHFLLRHFLTKGQENVWPKYVLLSPRLLDKLELTINELEATGTPVRHVGVISGFRTPSYNAGGGNTAGRGSLSRHMYGDAMDWFVDNDQDGRMDDLNGDGAVNTGDGRVIVEAAERVEQKHPGLIGGIGLYSPTGAHAGFVHIDTRGYRARW